MAAATVLDKIIAAEDDTLNVIDHNIKILQEQIPKDIEKIQTAGDQDAVSRRVSLVVATCEKKIIQTIELVHSFSRTELAETIRQVREAAEQITLLEATLEEKEEAYAALKTAKEEIEAKFNQIDEKYQKIIEAYGNFDNIASGIKQLTDDAEDAKRDAARKKQELEAAQQEILTHKRDLETLRKDLDKAQKAADALKTNYDEQIKEKEASIGTLKESYKKLSAAFKAKGAQADSKIRERIAGLMEELQAARKDIEDLKLRKTMVDTVVQGQTKKIGELTATISAREAEISTLQMSKASLESQATAWENKHKELLDKWTALNAGLRSQDSATRKLLNSSKKELELYEEQVKGARKTLQEVEERVVTIEEEHRKAIGELLKQKTTLNTETAELEAEIGKKRIKLSETEDKAAQLEAEIAQKKQEYAAERSALDALKAEIDERAAGISATEQKLLATMKELFRKAGKGDKNTVAEFMDVLKDEKFAIVPENLTRELEAKIQVIEQKDAALLRASGELDRLKSKVDELESRGVRVSQEELDLKDGEIKTLKASIDKLNLELTSLRITGEKNALLGELIFWKILLRWLSRVSSMLERFSTVLGHAPAGIRTHLDKTVASLETFEDQLRVESVEEATVDSVRRYVRGARGRKSIGDEYCEQANLLRQLIPKVCAGLSKELNNMKADVAGAPYERFRDAIAGLSRSLSTLSTEVSASLAAATGDIKEDGGVFVYNDRPTNKATAVEWLAEKVFKLRDYGHEVAELGHAIDAALEIGGDIDSSTEDLDAELSILAQEDPQKTALQADIKKLRDNLPNLAIFIDETHIKGFTANIDNLERGLAADTYSVAELRDSFDTMLPVVVRELKNDAIIKWNALTGSYQKLVEPVKEALTKAQLKLHKSFIEKYKGTKNLLNTKPATLDDIIEYCNSLIALYHAQKQLTDQMKDSLSSAPGGEETQTTESQYTCPECEKPVKKGQTKCSHCKTELSWDGVA
ncbi:MAG: hypothetical protein ABH829_00670 [archaeon]